MIRGFFRLIFQIVILAILIVIGTGAWVVYDGISDKGTEADCAVVSGQVLDSDGRPGAILKERLDLAGRLFRDQKIQMIIVSGQDHSGGRDEATGMAQYLKSTGVPAKSLMQDHGGISVGATAQDVAAIMKKMNFHSVMVVGSYYQITRIKLALSHEGVVAITQAHVGTPQLADGSDISREVVEIYYYIYNVYLKPTTDKVTVQAKALTEQLTKKVDSATEKVKDTAAPAK